MSFNGPCSMIIILHLKLATRGSGGDSVGRAVTFDSRGPQFESSHRKKLYWISTVNCIEKTKIMKKGREWPILKNSRNNLVGPDWALFESSWWQFSYKSRFGILMGHFENHHRGGKIWYGYSLTTFDKFGYFLFQHIWSHCSTRCSDWLTYGPHIAKSKF